MKMTKREQYMLELLYYLEEHSDFDTKQLCVIENAIYDLIDNTDK